MSERAGRVTVLLAAAAALGWLADALFVGHPPGLNVVLFATCFVAALAVVLRAGRAPLHQGRRWMALPLLVFSAAFAWHDARVLVATNLIALAGAVSLGALRRARPKPQDATLGDYAGGLVSAGLGTLAGSIELLERDVPWRDATASLRGPRAASFARGLALGAPLVALFGGLFLAADDVFRRLVTSALTAFPSPWPHALVVLGAAWASAGLLRDLAAERLHLTYAEYARHGFFELLAVTALVVPVVLAASAVARDRLRVVRALCAVLVLLELAVAASALQRLHVYVHE